MRQLPLWVRKALVDAIESAVAAIAVISWIVPDSVDSAKRQALVFAVAIVGAVIAAFRRAFLERGLESIRKRVIGDEEAPASDSPTDPVTDTPSSS